MKETKLTRQKLGLIMSVTGAIGLWSAIILTIEKLNIAADVNYVPSCSINPVVSCGKVIGSAQASAFGFPNSLIGIASFAAIIAIGMALVAKADFAQWFWRGLQAGVVFGLGFVTWLMYQSIAVIGALCPYCLVVWAVMIPLFVYVTSYNLDQNNLGVFAHKKIFTEVQLTVLLYVAVGLIILVRFWDYWSTVAPFNTF